MRIPGAEIQPLPDLDPDRVGLRNLGPVHVADLDSANPRIGAESEGVLDHTAQGHVRLGLTSGADESRCEQEAAERKAPPQSSPERVPHAMQKRHSGSRASPHEGQGTSFTSVPQNGQKLSLSRLGRVSRHH